MRILNEKNQEVKESKSKGRKRYIYITQFEGFEILKMNQYGFCTGLPKSNYYRPSRAPLDIA